jgi:hypothetical protein
LYEYRMALGKSSGLMGGVAAGGTVWLLDDIVGVGIDGEVKEVKVIVLN